MKNIKKWIPRILFAGCCGAFLLYYVMTRGIGDHEAPVLTVPETPLQVSVYATEQELMAGISAMDDEDGDVTEGTIVESISDIYDGNRAVITYTAFDRAGNVAKAQRVLEYTDYTGPHFTLSQPLIFREGMSHDVFAPVGAVDMVDGRLDERIKGTLVTGQAFIDHAGIYEVEFRVTNSLGDTAHLTVPVEVAASSGRARRLTLSSYLVYIEKGSGFDAGAYLTGSSRDYVSDVISDVNPSVPGTYTVTYTDVNGESYGKTRLIVVVEE